MGSEILIIIMIYVIHYTSTYLLVESTGAYGGNTELCTKQYPVGASNFTDTYNYTSVEITDAGGG